MRRLLTALAGLGLILLGLGHLGHWWPPGDSLSVARLHLLGLALPVLGGLAAVGGTRRALILMLPVLASAAVTVAALAGGTSPASGGVTLYQKNLLYLGRDPAALLSDILAADPDLITLQETSDQNDPLIFGLIARYPHHLICRGGVVGGVSVFSRFPLRLPERACDRAPGLALVQVERPGATPFWLAALHLSWPWPYGQAAQTAQVAVALSTLDGPIVLGGDFNMVPWGASVRAIAAAGDMARPGGYLSSFPQFGPLVPLAIDQVMVPKGTAASVVTRDTFGSDHRGLLARIAL